MLDFQKGGGLLPAIVQDAATGEILMVAYQNQEAFDRTQQTGKMHYYSRSRDRIWLKGETSGHEQEVVETLVDCDADAVVYKVHQRGGAACHEGYNSCFFRRVEPDGTLTIIKDEKVFDPEEVYGK
jgi:phosphoribosyl-AMP cyclohydrolase